MKHLLTALVILMAQAVSVNPLVGLWESDVKSKGGIGAALEFRSDGTYTQATTVLVDAFYRVVGDRLVMGDRPPAVDADTTAAGVLSFRDNQCLMTSPDGSVVVTKERVGQAQEGLPPIVGVWRYQHPAGGIAFERYTSDGHISLRLPIVSESGRFTLSEGTVALARDSGPETRMNVKLKGNALTLNDASSKASDWHRVVEGAWYQIKK